MNKSKALRIGGFTLAVGVTASLVGFAAHATGAYFQGSTPGTIQGETGHITVTSDTTNTLAFNGLNPGQYVNKTVDYKTDSTGNTDVWLYFPQNRAYEYFTGIKADPGGGGMGRYGHFAVADSGGTTVFSSYNLQNSGDDNISGCADANGHGLGRAATSEADTPPLCGVPHYILLQSNVPSGTSGHLTMTFGVTGRQTQQYQAAPPYPVDFQVVATQAGISPTAGNF